MTRLEFLKSTAALAAIPGLAKGDDAAPVAAPETAEVIAKPDAPPRNRRPYSGLDWEKCKHIYTTSHGHCTSQAHIDTYLKHGYGLLTISNYYPSAPTVPGKDFTVGYYRTHHDFPVMVNGARKDGPFDWNAIIEPWKNEIKDKRLLAQLPFKPSKAKMFPKWPEGMLEAPNAEHHGFLLDNGQPAGSLHMCAPGSAYASGTFDAHNRFLTKSHGYHFGTGERWRTAVDRMIAGLIHPDGGGVTINHPSWTHLDRKLMLEILDHDPRILGCEVMEHGYNSEHYWDWALSTGRQCFGFFVPDWGVGDGTRDFGANVLVVPEPTVHECMKAYRQGNFYGSLHALNELHFTYLGFDGKTVRAATDKPAKFQLITARGVVQETTGTEMTWELRIRSNKSGKPIRRGGPIVEVFARVKAFATDGSEEVIFSQPFMLF